MLGVENEAFDYDNQSESETNFTPKFEDYEQLDVLGEGSYGRIYKVREKFGKKRTVVIKEIDTSQL